MDKVFKHCIERSQWGEHASRLRPGQAVLTHGPFGVWTGDWDCPFLEDTYAIWMDAGLVSIHEDYEEAKRLVRLVNEQRLVEG